MKPRIKFFKNYIVLHEKEFLFNLLKKNLIFLGEIYSKIEI